MLSSYSPDQLTAFWSGVAAIATVATGVVAIMTFLAIRSDSRDRSRPVMSADLLPLALTDGSSELVITNLGQSVARRVQVTFDPPLPQLSGEARNGLVTPYLRDRYLGELPVVGPGRQLRNVYSVGVPGGGDDLVNDEPTPDNITVKFVYEDSHGREYRDEYPLTLNMLMNETEHFPSGGEETHGRRTVKALEAIARSIDRRQ